jgi:adenosylmethionine-8-amino-7-oxononanoate aminotransferase
MDGTTQLLETDRQFLVHPLHHPEEHKAPFFVDHGKGDMLYDVNGKGLIDGLSGLWNVDCGCSVQIKLSINFYRQLYWI